MKQTDWKIIYTKYDGVLKRAIQLLSKEAGGYIIRESGVYTVYVLPCEKEGCSVSKNAFLVGCYSDSPKIKALVKKSEIPQGGYLVKVVKNPDDEDARLVILTAHDELSVFYAVVSFLDDYITGDKYFKTLYPGHNLVRTRCQIHLARDIDRKFDELSAIVREIAK